MPDTLTDKISTARNSGYSDDDITKFLSDDPDVGSKVKVALGQGHASKEILDFLGSQPPLKTGTLDAATEFVKGAGAGVTSTAIGARDAANKVLNPARLPVPDFPKSVRDFARGPNDNPMFNVGKGAEQLGEFFAPAGLIGKGVKAFSKLGAVAGPVGEAIAGTAARGTLEGLSAGAIEALHNGGDYDQAAKTALTAGITSGAFSTIGGVLKSVAPKLYSLADYFPSRTPESQVGDVIDDAIRNGVRISPTGLKKAGSIVAARGSLTDAAIAQNAGTPIDIKVLEQPVNEFRKFAQRIGDPGLLKKINTRWNNLQDAYGAQAATPGSPGTPAQQIPSTVLGPSGQPIMRTVPGTSGTPATAAVPATITVGDAQQLKQDFQQMVAEAYGKANRQKLNKAIAAGFRESLEDAIPEVKELNRNTQNAILLQNAIEKAVNAKNSGLTPGVAIAALFKASAGETLWLMKNPTVRSTLAILADRTGNVMPKLAGPAGRVAASSFAPPIPELDTSKVKTQ